MVKTKPIIDIVCRLMSDYYYSPATNELYDYYSDESKGNYFCTIFFMTNNNIEIYYDILQCGSDYRSDINSSELINKTWIVLNINDPEFVDKFKAAIRYIESLLKQLSNSRL